MLPLTITLLAGNILSQRQPLTATRIRMTDWLIRGGFRVAAVFQKTNLLQILRKIVGIIYSVVWTPIHFRACKYERYATGPYYVEL